MVFEFLTPPLPTCFVCLIKYLVLSFLIIIRQSKSKKETLREENIQMKFKTSIFETENMCTSIHPRQFRSIWHLVHLTESILRNQKHPPPSISEDFAERCTSRNFIQKIVIKNSVFSRKKKVRNICKQFVQ